MEFLILWTVEEWKIRIQTERERGERFIRGHNQSTSVDTILFVVVDRPGPFKNGR